MLQVSIWQRSPEYIRSCCWLLRQTVAFRQGGRECYPRKLFVEKLITLKTLQCILRGDFECRLQLWYACCCEVWWCIIRFDPKVAQTKHFIGDHSPDNVKFPGNSLTFLWRFATLLPMLSVTHIMLVLVLLPVLGVGMQQCMIQNQNKMHKISKVKNGHKYAANNKQF